MIKAVIFDMDGVVLDSEKYWPSSDRKLYESIMPDFNPQRLPNTMGMGNKVVYDVLKELFQLDLSPEEFSLQRTEAAKQNIYSVAGLMPGFLTFILGIRKNGIKTALGSSSPRDLISLVFKTHPEIVDLFDAVITADEVEGRTKPFPDIFLKAAEQISIEPAGCIVIEDADHGVKAAIAAGMKVYGFRNGINEHQSLEGSDLIFDDFSQLEKSGFFSFAFSS